MKADERERLEKLAKAASYNPINAPCPNCDIGNDFAACNCAESIAAHSQLIAACGPQTVLALLRADATLERAKKVIKARIASIPPLDDFRMEPREREALRDALALLTEEKP